MPTKKTNEIPTEKYENTESETTASAPANYFE